ATMRSKQQDIEAFDPAVLLQLPVVLHRLSEHLERLLLSPANDLAPADEQSFSSHDPSSAVALIGSLFSRATHMSRISHERRLSTCSTGSTSCICRAATWQPTPSTSRSGSGESLSLRSTLSGRASRWCA